MTSEEATRVIHPFLVGRGLLARELRGKGIEFGPGCHPLPTGPMVSAMIYVDRFDRAGFLERFPEAAGEIAGFPETIHHLVNFEEDFTTRLGVGEFDFVVASHVLEHLVDPIAFLSRCHHLVKEGGLFFLAIPDKRSAFDVERARTRLAELVDRHARHMTTLTDEMIIEFVNSAEKPAAPFGPATPGYAERVERIRERSIHANVWVVDDLLELLAYVGRSEGAPFELMNGLVTDGEAIFVLRKTNDPAVTERYAGVMSRVWHESKLFHWRMVEEPRLAHVERLLLETCDRIARLDERARETQNFVKRIKSALERLPWLGKVSRRLGRKLGS